MSLGSEVTRLNAALAGRYAIEREIGRGGMATVYLARDLKHDRLVALKLLDPELGAVLGVERFLAEIRVTANLQHPNLLPLFDSGEADGLLYYVMPYVAGESLRARLDRERQLPVDETVRLASAVADALQYAHEHGVVHRDLKPENILLQHGQPLVADFGIALAVSRAGGARVTQTGLSLGTPQYMSPEQAAGDRVIDGRSDIYSLGAVTYEMLAGDPPHTGSTVQAIVSKVLTERPPDVRVQRPNVPEPVALAIARALEKIPADRFDTAGQFAAALQGRAPALLAGAHAPPRGRRIPLAALVLPWILAAAGIAVAALLWMRQRATPESPVARFALDAGPIGDGRSVNSAANSAAISPDGRTIVYLGAGENGAGEQLWIRALDDPRPRPLAGSEGGHSPFFSPDGRWVGFSEVGGTLRKVPLEGGPVVTVSGRAADNATWTRGDVIVMGAQRSTSGSALWAVPASGGAAHPLTTLDVARGERLHDAPLALDDGKTLVFADVIGGATQLAIVSLDGGPHTVLDVHGSAPVGMVDGRLVYIGEDGSTLMAVPLDLRRRRVTGAPVSLLDGLAGEAALARDGTLLYAHGAQAATVVTADAHGATQPLVAEPRPYEHPRLSPDGEKLALSIFSGAGEDIWLYDLRSRTLTRLTTDGSSDRAEWSPDGRRIVFRSLRGERGAVWWQSADGSGSAERLASGGAGAFEGVVSPDGRTLLYRIDTPDNARDVYYRTLQGDTTPHPFLAEKFDELMPRWSPDGRWVVYVSDESGVREVYVRPFPGPGGRVQISAGGGMEPLWSADGKRIFYRGGGKIVAANIALSPAGAFQVIGREALFDDTFRAGPYHADWDVTRDGRHFVLLASPKDQGVQLMVVTNWPREMHARLAASGR